MKLETSCEVAIFASTSGHCGFDCQYCIINPIAKHQPSLVFEDYRFICDFFDTPVFFALSGVGDFMVSYARSQRLLERLLGLDVEVALDTNGAALQELPELAPERLEKLRFINLTMHYHQIKTKNLLNRWPANARTILERRFEQTHPDYILSPPLRDEWEEAIAFYAETVYAHTGRPLIPVRDVNRPFTPDDEDRLARLYARFGEVLAGEYVEDFAAAFRGRPEVLCPAGMRYFRVWNDGRVQGCPNLPGVPSLRDCGNVKERRLTARKTLFRCDTPAFCDCSAIDKLGMMQTPVE